MADEALKARDRWEDTREKAHFLQAAGKGESLRGLWFVQLVFCLLCSPSWPRIGYIDQVDQIDPTLTLNLSSCLSLVSEC